MLTDREIQNLVGMGLVFTGLVIFFMLSVAIEYMPECG